VGVGEGDVRVPIVKEPGRDKWFAWVVISVRDGLWAVAMRENHAGVEQVHARARRVVTLFRLLVAVFSLLETWSFVLFGVGTGFAIWKEDFPISALGHKETPL
jgi:hypothetical protein